MAKSKNDEQDSLAINGDFALKAWAVWCYDRGPDWQQTNILWRAARGGGHGKVKEMEPPKDIELIESAVVRLPPVMRTVVRCYYIDKYKRPELHAKELQMSKSAFFDKLRIARYLVGGWV